MKDAPLSLKTSFWFFLSSAIFCFGAAPVLAQTTATHRETAIGSPCSKNAHSGDYDSLAQCNNADGAGGVMQKAPLFVGPVTSPPYATTDCDTNKAGMIQWTGSALQYCNGTGWVTIGLANTPEAFSFTNQSDVAASTTITSNTAILKGFSGSATATCGTGCTAIARNGTWGGTTVTDFVAGDSIAIRQVSSASPLTTTNATVTVGETTSGTWSVTTIDDAPDPIAFTDVPKAYAGAYVVSNTVTLAGFSGSVTATCTGGCAGISKNGT